VYGVMFVGRPLYMIGNGNYTYATPLSITDVSRGFDKMLFLAFLGATAFVVGYFLPFGRKTLRKRTRRRVWNLTVAARAAILTAAVGAAALVAVLLHARGWGALGLVFSGRTPGLTAAIEGTSFYPWAASLVLVPAGLLLLAFACERRQKRLWVAFIVDAIFVGLRALPEGDRTALLLFVGGAVVVVYLQRQRRPRVLTLVALALAAIYVSAFLSDLRGRSTRDESVIATAANIASRPGQVWTRMVSGPDSEMAPVLAAAVAVIPSRESYTYGMTMVRDVFERPIPRALWTDKPQPPRDHLISLLWPKDFNSAHQSINPEFSILLYPYWDFGYVGVILFLAIVGVGVRILSNYGRFSANDSLEQALFAASLWLVPVVLRDTPTEALTRAVFVIGPILIIMRVSRRRVALGMRRGAGLAPPAHADLDHGRVLETR
jgi:hypothetical protein